MDISKYSIRLRVQYSYLDYFHPDTVIITPQFIMFRCYSYSGGTVSLTEMTQVLSQIS